MSEYNINHELIQRRLTSQWQKSTINVNESYLQNLVRQIVIKLKKFDMKRTLNVGAIIKLDKPVLNVKLKHVIKALIQLLNIKKTEHGSIIFTNLDDPFLMTNDPKIITRIIQSLNQYENIEINFTYSEDIEKCTRLIVTALSNDDSIKPANQLPNHLILTNDYKLFNTDTRKYENIEDYLHFDFVYKSNWSYIDDESIKRMSDVERSKFEINLEKANRLINGWSAKDDNIDNIDENKKMQLMQIQIAAIEGNSRGKYVELIGAGGNGKSSFLHVISHLVGLENSIDLNVHQLGDDNMLGNISINKRVIIGHENTTSFRVEGKLMTRYKSIAMNEAMSIIEKYRAPRVIQFFGLGIQASNSYMEFAELNQAILDRRFPIAMSSINFRKKRELALDVMSLVKDQDFMSAYATYLFNNCPPFKYFAQSEEDVEEIVELTRSGDNFSQFIDDEFYKYDGIQFLSPRAMYESYKKWCKRTNINPLTMRNFNKQLQRHLEDLDYIYSDRNSLYRFNITNDQVSNMPSYAKYLSDSDAYQTRYYEKKSDYIMDLDVNSFIEKLKLGDITDELTNKEQIILTWIALNNSEYSTLAQPFLGRFGINND